MKISETKTGSDNKEGIDDVETSEMATSTDPLMMLNVESPSPDAYRMEYARQNHNGNHDGYMSGYVFFL